MKSSERCRRWIINAFKVMGNSNITISWATFQSYKNCISKIHFKWDSSLLSNMQSLRCGHIFNWCTTEWKCSYLFFLLTTTIIIMTTQLHTMCSKQTSKQAGKQANKEHTMREVSPTLCCGHSLYQLIKSFHSRYQLSLPPACLWSPENSNW